MRSGVSKLLRAMAVAGVELSAKHVKMFHATLEDNLKNPNESIQLDAKDALKEFSKLYHPKYKGEAAEIVKKLLASAVKDENVAITKGFTMALGSFCEEVLLAFVRLRGHVVEYRNCGDALRKCGGKERSE